MIVGLPPPFGSAVTVSERDRIVDHDRRFERVALPRVVERRDVELVRQFHEAAQLVEPLGVDEHVADARARRGVVVLEAIADRDVVRALERPLAVVLDDAVVAEARVHHPVVRHPLAAREFEAVEGAREVRRVDQLCDAAAEHDAAQLERGIVRRDRFAASVLRRRAG